MHTLKKRELPSNIVRYVLLLLGGAVSVMPMIYMISTSLKPNGALYEFPPKFFPALDTITIENYVYIFSQEKFYINFLNSVIVAVLTVVIAAFVSSALAFCLARFRFPGRKALFALVIGTMRERVGGDFREGAAPEEIRQHPDQAPRGEQPEVEVVDSHVHAELVGGDIDRDNSGEVADRGEEGYRDQDSGNFSEDEVPAIDRFGEQQQHGSVAHLPRDRVAGAEHTGNQPEDQTGRHGTVHHQFELFGEDEERRRRIMADQNQRAEEHQKEYRLPDRFPKGVCGDFEEVEHQPVPYL